MASGKPIVRQVAWLSLLPQFLVMGLLILLFSLFVKPFNTALIIALLVYLTISNSLRFGIPRNHRKGMSLTKSNQYSKAIDEFEKSYDFFTKHTYIDKYRFITLLSSSRISYTEMALLNMAFCNAQIGNGEKAKFFYEKTLEQFPNSQMARTSLNMILAIETNMK